MPKNETSVSQCSRELLPVQESRTYGNEDAISTKSWANKNHSLIQIISISDQ